jgi:hypothetical protein
MAMMDDRDDRDRHDMNDVMADEDDHVERGGHRIPEGVFLALGILITNIMMIGILAIPAHIQEHNNYLMSWKMSRVTSGDVTVSSDMRLVSTAIVDDGSFLHQHKIVTITIGTPHQDAVAKDWCVDSGVDMSCHRASTMRVDGDHVILVFHTLPVKGNHVMLSGLFYKDNKTTAVAMNDDWPAW